jgi:RNA-directed DNA polymerase
MDHEPDFQQVFVPENLHRIWGRIQDRHFDLYRERPIIQTGSDGIQYRHFLRDEAMHLAAISRKVLDGRYTFAPFLEVEKEKLGSIDKRIISIASIRDTIVQTALYEYLYPRVDPLMTESVYGYRKGRNAHAAIRRIVQEFGRGRIRVFDADFSKFFDSVDHDIMLAKLAEIEYDARAGALFRRYLKTARVTPAEVRARLATTAKPSKYPTEARLRGLPQGGVLSGLASNLYLAEFDEWIVGLHQGYIRYADDFIVCCDSEVACGEVHAKVKERAAELKLTLNGEKTRECVRAEEGIEFLGFKIDTNSIRVRGKNIARFKHRITTIINHSKPTELPESTLSRLSKRLGYKICGPSRADMDRLAARGLADHPHRRCWIGFFRIITDESQISRLDRWIRSKIASYMWRTHRVRVKYRDMRNAGLRSLIAALHRARRRAPRTLPVSDL